MEQKTVDFRKKHPDNGRVIWKNYIAELQAAGMTQQDIANAVGKSQAWVSAVTRGLYADMKWSDVEALRVLRDKVCEQKQAA